MSGQVKTSKQTRIDYMADFETTTDPLDCRVWSWGFVTIENPDYHDVIVGHSLEDFLAATQRHNGNWYFHNLKFDGTFIIDWLLKNGYEHEQGRFKLQPGHFKSMISNMGQFYSITVAWKNGKTAEFRDSLKKLPMPVSRIAKSFKLEESKGEIDYDAPRPVGYQMSAEEEDYLRRDVTIVAQAIKIQLDQGMTKLTVASDALAEFKALFGDKKFKRTFPVLPEMMDAEIRQAYRGGFTYASDRYMKKRCGPGLVLDVNSLYPHIMHSSFLPYGEPKYFRGRYEANELHPLSVFSVTFTARLKKDHIPCIQVKGQSFFVNTEYLKVIKDPVTLWVTNVDWELWNEHYNIEVQSWNGGWAFRGAYGFFDEFIDKWSRIKAESTDGLRELAKLMLNSLYGKFASNPNVTSKIPVLENERVKFVLGENETRPPVYTAMGAFITAYARALTIRAAQANYDTFAYADTDSLHLLRQDVPSAIDVHPSKLGAWKLEYHFDEALYVRAKFYLERLQDGSYVNRIAGVPERVSGAMTFDDVRDGNVLHGKLTPKNVPGGIVLTDAPFTIKL